jgi:hypothetical protein
MKYHCIMNTDGHEKTAITFSLLLLSLVALPLLISGTGAVSADSGQQAYVLPTPTDLAVTNVSLANHTFPGRYQVDPARIDVQIEVSETLLPAQKGEMAAGPRTISPVSLAVLVLVVVAVAAGMWYIVKRKPDEDTEGKPDEDTEGKPDEDTEGKPDEDTEGKPDEDTEE